VDECPQVFPTTNTHSHLNKPKTGSLRATMVLRASDRS
jgi:hypothetical protein